MLNLSSTEIVRTASKTTHTFESTHTHGIVNICGPAKALWPKTGLLRGVFWMMRFGTFCANPGAHQKIEEKN